MIAITRTRELFTEEMFADGGDKQWPAVGDTVDEAFYWYCLEVVPPAAMAHDLVQIGEPADCGPDGHDRFETLQRAAPGEWVYTGRHKRGTRCRLVEPCEEHCPIGALPAAERPVHNCQDEIEG